jgi:hypothetical protein
LCGWCGDQGPPGKPATFDWSKLTVRPKVITTFDPSGFTYLQADCLPGEHVLNGGISVEGGFVTRSNPLYQWADVIATCVRP